MADEERVASILGDWCERRDRGEAVDPQAVVRTHPDLADDLREGFAALHVADLALHVGRPADVAAAALNAPDASAALAPIRRDRYRDFRPIGAGAMGIVYLTLDTELNRKVAMKVVRPPTVNRGKTPDPFDLTPPPAGSRTARTFRQLIERFLQEAWLTGALEHPGIVPIYDLGRTPEGIPYYTMRYVKGVRTLDGELEKASTLEDRLTLLDPFLRICDAIRYAHSRGVIHRDLKPANIGLGEFGEVVVLDWGLAKMREQPDLTTSAWQAKIREFRQIRDMHTATSALGTPGYMSPEAALGNVDSVDERSDVYSLGAILYRILTGRLPFAFGTYPELLHRLQHERAPAPSKVEASVPEDLSRICQKALAGRSSQRFADARLLADAIRGYQKQSAIRSEVRALIHEAQAAFEGTEGLEGEALLRQLDRVTGLCQRVLHQRSGHVRARRLIGDCKALRARALEGREKQIERKAHEARLALIRRETERRERMRLKVMLSGLLLLVILSGIFAWIMLGQRKAAREAEARAHDTLAELEDERVAAAKTRRAWDVAKDKAVRLRSDLEKVSAARAAAERTAAAARDERDRAVSSGTADVARSEREKKEAHAEIERLRAELAEEKGAREEAEEREEAARDARDRALEGLEAELRARRETEERPGRAEALRPKPEEAPAGSGLQAAIEKLRSRDPAERVAAVEELVPLPGQGASKALAKAMGDRGPAVRAAVIRALGRRGDEVSVEALHRGLRRFADDSDTLRLLVAAIGTAGDVSSAGEIRKVVLKARNVDDELTRAAIETLGLLRCPEAVDALLLLTETESVNTRGRRGLAEYENAVLKSLRRVTGLPHEEAKTWHLWWRHAKRDWTPPPLELPKHGRKFLSQGWRFRIDRPEEERWDFSRPEGTVVRVGLRGPGAADSAWVEVRAFSALETVTRRPGSKSEYRDRCLRGAWKLLRKDMKRAFSEMEKSSLDESAAFGGERALRHSVVGTLKDGRRGRWEAYIVERNLLLYAVSSCLPIDSNEKVRADVDAILRSFRFLDPR